MLADVQFDIRGQVVVAKVTGEVDLSNATQLCDAIGEATDNTALGVVLDLVAVDYLDSAGIHLIYRLRENLRARGQRLMLSIPTQSPVQDSLRLAGVTRALPIASSVEEALVVFAPRDAAQKPAEGSDRDTPQGEPAV
ncbi:MAG: STAS domain-containing protein [Solirubrobacteraceae bacterium]